MGILFLLFIIVPIAELFLLIEVGQLIGAWDTVLIVFLSGFLGAYTARNQGMSLLFSIKQQLAHGQLPTESLIQGFLVFIGGILLITPGFLTDILGLSLIFPITRKFFLNRVKDYFQRKLKTGGIKFYTNINGEWQSPQGPRDVTPNSQKINNESAKIIDIDRYRSTRDQ